MTSLFVHQHVDLSIMVSFPPDILQKLDRQCRGVCEACQPSSACRCGTLVVMRHAALRIASFFPLTMLRTGTKIAPAREYPAFTSLADRRIRVEGSAGVNTTKPNRE